MLSIESLEHKTWQKDGKDVDYWVATLSDGRHATCWSSRIKELKEVDPAWVTEETRTDGSKKIKINLPKTPDEKKGFGGGFRGGQVRTPEERHSIERQVAQKNSCELTIALLQAKIIDKGAAAIQWQQEWFEQLEKQLVR